MLILLPPSEGKSAPRRGRPLDLDRLSRPALNPARQQVLDALQDLCASRPADEAAAVLGLGSTQRGEVARDAALDQAPTARADRVYTGVLYEALDLAGLDAAAKRRATSRLAIASGLFGLLGPADPIPAYRLSGQVTLPGLGSVAGHWARHLGPVVEETSGLVIDLRSSTYAAFWRPSPSISPRVASVRVLHETDGRRSVVSHFNKATKGRLVRALLQESATPRHPRALAEQLRDLGWQVELDEPARRPARLDVVVSAL